ncbi:hypothetical protein BLNAU_15743 [Blattamonas nauphoetae]|uniref:Uncharacterized protein n=1 Tax=Blattamonas nauphoetae TaxID=2049346 RepID=A0ABQ9XA79_9EUKA|nr:hypothetical protein BLNAU_15743 [Blattamonas nauphoetae]
MNDLASTTDKIIDVRDERKAQKSVFIHTSLTTSSQRFHFGPHPNTRQSTADTFEKFQFNHSDDIRILAANPNLLSLPTVVITVDMMLEMLADFLSLSHRSHRVTAALGLRDAVQVGCEFFA